MSEDTTLKEDEIRTESTWSETKSEVADTGGEEAEGDSDGTDSGGGADADDSDSDSDDSDT